VTPACATPLRPTARKWPCSPRGGQFKDWFSAVAFSPDERFIAATDIAGQVQVWELE